MTGKGRRGKSDIVRSVQMLDDIAEAVLAREEVLKYPRDQVHAYLDELRTTQRHKFYRALQHPLYPILRKIERKDEHVHYVTTAVRTQRIVYASNHKSHTDYLVEPLALDDNGIRPPLIAAGINLFGGPLGLIHKHVTGAIPIRRNTKDPAYLITLKAYVAEILKKHDLFFYPEGGRSYSGELKPAKTGLFNEALAARRANLGVTSGQQAIEEAADALETRGIIVAERGRFRVRERTVLRYYARTIEHLLATSVRTH